MNKASDKMLMLVYLTLLLMLLFSKTAFGQAEYTVELMDSLAKSSKNTVVVVCKHSKCAYIEVSKKDLEEKQDEIIKQVMEEVRSRGI
ncbi:MAG TPA: hypothetical protein PKI14_01540 [Fervidobacterium sp.]|nr:hypothetical protein [Fervidobacterium sp.]